MKSVLQILTSIAFALCALSFLGVFIPAFDSLSVARPLTWLAAGAGTFLLTNYPQFLMRGALVVMAFPFLSMFDQSRDFETPALRIYQHNLLYTNTGPDLQMVTERRTPDVLTLQEIKEAKDTLATLKDYPYQHFCSFTTIGDVGVVSKYPFLETGCPSGEWRGFAWARIEKDGQPVTIVSMHLHWPFPYQQNAQLEEILPQIEALPQPIVLAGDMNQVLWSATRRRIERATGAPALDGLRFTLVRFPLFLPIDQAFGAGIHNVEKLERYGSDHNALLIDFQSIPGSVANSG